MKESVIVTFDFITILWMLLILGLKYIKAINKISVFSRINIDKTDFKQFAKFRYNNIELLKKY